MSFKESQVMAGVAQLRLIGTHERADLTRCATSKAQVLIEVELRRGNPAVNILKTWLWARNRKPKSQLTLIHALSLYYDSERNRNPRAKTWSKYMDFVAERVRADKDAKLKYIAIPFAELSGCSN